MKRSDELVMERPAKAATIRQPDPGAIKSILFYIHDDDELEVRLQSALSLARACSAHLQLLNVVPLEAYTVVDAFGTFVSGEVVEMLTGEAEKLRLKVQARLAAEDVSWSYDVRCTQLLAELFKEAALSDLVVIGRRPPYHEFSFSGPGLLGELVSSARTPLCVPGDRARVFDPFGSALIAWNGSVEVANAVRQTVGLLKMASEVRVISFSEDKESAFPDTRLLEYLSRHGITAVLDVRKCRRDFAADLVEYAGVFGVEYMVMGAYSHSRAGEWLFGGVTRELLHECPIPIVMGH